MDFRKIERYFNLLIFDETPGITFWIAGGAIRDKIEGIEIRNDIDLFFPNEFQLAKMTVYLFRKGEKVHETRFSLKIKYKNKIFDLNKKFFESEIQTIDSFDFTACMLAFDGKIFCDYSKAIDDIQNKALRLHNLTYPGTTLLRIVRYYKYGYSISIFEIKKIVAAIKVFKNSEYLLKLASSFYLTHNGHEKYKRLATYLKVDIYFTEKTF